MTDPSPNPLADREQRLALFQMWFSDTIPHSKALGIRIVDAMGVYISILKQRGGAGPDGRHLSVEGNKKVAAALVGMVR